MSQHTYCAATKRVLQSAVFSAEVGSHKETDLAAVTFQSVFLLLLGRCMGRTNMNGKRSGDFLFFLGGGGVTYSRTRTVLNLE